MISFSRLILFYSIDLFNRCVTFERDSTLACRLRKCSFFHNTLHTFERNLKVKVCRFLRSGDNFTKLFLPSKSCRRAAFDEKFSVQLHQQSSKAKIRSNIAKICTQYIEHRLTKKRPILGAKKSCTNVDEIDLWSTVLCQMHARAKLPNPFTFRHMWRTTFLQKKLI